MVWRDDDATHHDPESGGSVSDEEQEARLRVGDETRSAERHMEDLSDLVHAVLNDLAAVSTYAQLMTSELSRMEIAESVGLLGDIAEVRSSADHARAKILELSSLIRNRPRR